MHILNGDISKILFCAHNECKCTAAVVKEYISQQLVVMVNKGTVSIRYV